ncbi:MAG TPA: amidase, partial [Alphaproteobacteria bacterium]|nr:amidase [Alphaproteobacteria bacterium]
MDDIAQQSATTLAAMLRAGKIGCVELLEHFLARLERLNPALNAVIATDIDRAMANADAADEARANGNFLGPLHGLPITIKDALAVPGMP